MGIFDSSATRVVPIFDQLLARDRSGASWLNQILALPRLQGHGRPAPVLEEPRLLAHGWGAHEKKLRAPLSLLEWLVLNVKTPADSPVLGTDETREWRERLLRREPEAIEEALRLARTGPARGWPVFEGPSQPDVYLETPDALIVIEGKRTEPSPTTSTTWMPVRHQMLRHIDAAWEVRKERPVYGFFVVEGDGGVEDVAVPGRWEDAATATVATEALSGSLPHRAADERRAIAAAFLGVTTWQAVCSALKIDWLSLPDRVPKAERERSNVD